MHCNHHLGSAATNVRRPVRERLGLLGGRVG